MVLLQAHELGVALLVLIFGCPLFEKHDVEFVLVHQSIHEPQGKGVGWRAHGQAIDVRVELGHALVAGRGDVPAHAGPEVLKEGHVLLPVGFRQTLPEEGFHRALVLVVRSADNGHFDAHVLQHALVKHRFHAHAAHVNATLGMQVHLIGDCAEPVGALGVHLAPCDDPFARLLEAHEGIAHFAQHGWVAGHHVRLNEDALDAVILRSTLHVSEKVVEAGLGFSVNPTEAKREGRDLHAALHKGGVEGQMEDGPLLDVHPEIEVGLDVLPRLREGRAQAANEGADKNEDENGAGCDECDGGAKQAGEELLSEVHGGVVDRVTRGQR